MNQWTVSLYLSEPKAAFTPNCESVAVEASPIRARGARTRSVKSYVSESGRRSIQSPINEAGKCHPLF